MASSPEALRQPNLRIRPDNQAVACNVKIIKNIMGLSDEALGNRTGVSRSTIYSYTHGEFIPSIDVVGKIFLVIENEPGKPNNPTITPGQRDELRERFSQAIIPHVIYASTYQVAYGQNAMEVGIKIRENFRREKERLLEALRGFQRRRDISATKTQLPTADNDMARLIEALVGGPFASQRDLAVAVGSAENTVCNWRTGRRGVSPEYRARLIRIAEDSLNTKRSRKAKAS